MKKQNREFIYKVNDIVILALIIFFLSCAIARAQDREQKFSAFAYLDPSATLDDGVNIGLGMDYQMNVMYFDAQLFVFPGLRGKTLTELTGTVLGFNYHNRWSTYRIYLGTKLGIIYRDGEPHPTYGLESGIDFNMPGTDLFIGVGGSYDYRTDGKVWEENADNYWRLSGLLKVGFKFN